MMKATMNHLEEVHAIFDVLHGRKEADLLMKNLNILDVHGETVYSGSLLIYHKRIVALNPDESIVKAKEVFDGQGLYAIPGLIDCHFHFESQLANPVALAEAMVPCGTTISSVQRAKTASRQQRICSMIMTSFHTASLHLHRERKRMHL